MALEKTARPLAQCLRCTRHDRIALPMRAFSSTTRAQEEVETVQPSDPPPPPPPTETPYKVNPRLDPLTVHKPRLERKMVRELGKQPIASRRRRAALATTGDIPFLELPYQCFQEARKFLQEDREEKIREIETERKRIAKLQDTVVVDPKEQAKKETSLRSMRRHLEDLKIKADINDPIVKKRFEDGIGDMNKPIYRHLADNKWRDYQRKVLMQRIETMAVVPDVLPKLDPIVSTKLSFPHPKSKDRRKNVQHGEIVDSLVSENPPWLEIQKYEKGEKLYSIAVVNPDVPNVEKDAFDYRCHYLAINVPLSPTDTKVMLGNLKKKGNLVIPWIPPYSQKGFPYQRLAIIIFEQPPAEKAIPGSSEVPPSQAIDVQTINQKCPQFARADNFHTRNFMARFRLTPVGADLFRTQWDENTANVMQKKGIPGWDVEFKRKRIEPLPYKRLKEERYR